MKNRFLLLALLLTASAHADSDWVSVGKDKLSAFDVRVGSYEERYVNGKAVYSVLFRYTDNKTKQIELMHWNVTPSDCARKYGSLFATDLTNDQVQLTNAFVFSAGTIASSVAEAICGIHEKRVDATL